VPHHPTAFDQSHGELLLQTGVSGKAAKLGHRLTLVLNRWRATVSWSDDRPVGVDFAAEVDSLEVVRGDGGVKGLSTPEKMVVRSNALKSFDVRQNPRITFGAKNIESTSGGYRLIGQLEIHGQVREWAIDLLVTVVDDAWTVSCESVVRQTDFGIKPYSLMLGALAVADEVTVSVTARHAKD
jgi:polyisoprenoid-binding protein YceI